MKPEEYVPIVTIIAFGCDNYDHLIPLKKVKEDLNRVKEILCFSSYSIFAEKQFIEVYDKTSAELRNEIQQYLFSRSADQDILILYFSGHGTAIGREDFGFCMKDTDIHPEDHIILPTSVVKLSEIIGTLSIKNVSLVLFVDSCYSGQVSKSLCIPFIDISGEMSTNLVASSGNLFGLITSCTDVEQINDNGVISKELKNICEQGSEENSQYLQLGYLSETINERIDSYSEGDSKSRVFIPSGRIFSLPFAKNVQYFIPPEPVNNYSFTNPYLRLLITLWNNGNPIALSPNEILDKTGSQSAYANHNKLSLSPWNLIRDNRNKKRELTQRGIDFINGNLSIPKIIMENKITRVCASAEGSPSIHVVEEKDLFGNLIKVFKEN
ncbi:MAG: caspase family protein [Candidatus Methanofastidiosa archaeon]|nr:caspase family protein [Candidatus Methanofastidiosa archaeon]